MFPTKQTPAAAILNPVVGQRSSTKLKNKVRTQRLRCRMEATVNLTGAGTAIRNAGNVVALFDAMGLSENGTDRWLFDPRPLHHVARGYAASTPNDVRLTSTAIGTYKLATTFYLDLAMPDTASPTETSFVEGDTRQVLEAFVQYTGDLTRLIAGAVGTITNVAIYFTQIYDAKTEAPLFIPTVRQMTESVVNANAEQTIYIKGSRYMRAMVISQDSDAGDVDDVIVSLAVRGDEEDLIGPKQCGWYELYDSQAAEMGGGVRPATEPRAHLFMKLYRNGRLSTVHNPAADRNLRIEAKTQPSAVVGASNCKIRITIFELERHAELTKPLPFAA
jgi:hypothetical protein